MAEISAQREAGGHIAIIDTASNTVVNTVDTGTERPAWLAIKRRCHEANPADCRYE